MMSQDLDVDNDDTPENVLTKYIEREGRGFKIVTVNSHGHWQIRHAKNNKPVNALPGTYTDLNAAIKAVNSMPAEMLPPKITMKTVLTPKHSKED